MELNKTLQRHRYAQTEAGVIFSCGNQEFRRAYFGSGWFSKTNCPFADADSMLRKCWASVVDASPTLTQYRVNVMSRVRRAFPRNHEMLTICYDVYPASNEHLQTGLGSTIAHVKFQKSFSSVRIIL